MNFGKFFQRNKIRNSVLGLSAAGTLAMNLLIVPWETRVHHWYWDDLGKVWTVCAGVTDKMTPVIKDKTYTDDECDTLEAIAIKVHEEGIRKAIKVPVPDLTMAAFISFTYNVGVGAASSSTLVRLANSGDLYGACNQLSRWTRVQGRVVRGLENRRFRGDQNRLSERAVCLTGLDPAYKTPLFERLYASYQTWLARKLKQEV